MDISWCYTITMAVPIHIIQPLYVDTNISYDLDMSLFPGLDDPQHIQQPALLISTDWNGYLYNDTQCDDLYNDKQCDHLYSDTKCDLTDEDTGIISNDDLFSLIESCQELLPESGNTDLEDFQSFLDDVIDETPDYKIFISEQLHLTSSWIDSDLDLQEDIQSSNTGKKRGRSEDSECPATKKAKMPDSASLQLPSLVSVCSTSSNCSALGRES